MILRRFPLSSWPDLFRPSTRQIVPAVDARNKSGHDGWEEWGASLDTALRAYSG